MPDISEKLAHEVITDIRHVLSKGMHKIEHCAAQLTNDQLWWRPRPEMNSIANLMLHLSGNIRQWVIAGVTQAKDTRNRPGEFNDRSNQSKNEILAKLQATVNEADEVLSHLTAAKLIEPRRIQGFDTTVLSAILDSVPHFRGHVQEIIHMTREQLGEKYKFDFVPKDEEQVSAGG
ncbi:MAG TPA: DUF1572 family protein [Tepidisphaeraceae bacterium]|nr:DUF1572 family protein [Tepidisphaeraceae bacterium]